MHEYWISYEWQAHDGRRGNGDAGFRQTEPLKGSDMAAHKERLGAKLERQWGSKVSIIILNIYKFEQEV